MRERLEKVLENSYAPYSNMHFACIVETKNGNFYEGVNVENASYGGTICAERSAILNAVSHGEREFRTLYLMTSSDEICYPCNICKQTFLEFFDKDVMFNIMTKSGKMEIMSFEKLMNTTFTKEDLV
jgi:cytidine deaminase